jgi:Thioredoxin
MRLADPVTSDDHVQGEPDAAVTLVQYGDYECPYTRMSRHSVHELQREFADTLRFVFRHFPLEEIHPHARAAAMAARTGAGVMAMSCSSNPRYCARPADDRLTTPVSAPTAVDPVTLQAHGWTRQRSRRIGTRSRHRWSGRQFSAISRTTVGWPNGRTNSALDSFPPRQVIGMSDLRLLMRRMACPQVSLSAL